MKRKHLLAAVALAASPPALAATPDTEAVEFYNVARDHYFVTAVASEAGAIDAGLAGPGWVRTGRSFQAWIDPAKAPPDAQPVCRFFAASIHSHFYTADAAECSFLRGNPTGWKYEGTAFYIQKPASGRCPAGTVEILRHYNNGFSNGQGSNHRFVDDATLSEFMQDGEWIVEGTAFCAAAKITGTSANLAPTRASFESLAGTWSGEAKWEIETGDEETEVRAPLELTLADDGTVTGSGEGCTFAGEVTQGDGFRAFFTGDIAATGCTNTAFNGDYPRLRLQLLRNGILMVQMKRGDDDTLEAKVQARLTLDGASPPPAGRPPRSFEGAWVGTVRWEAESEEQRIQANRPLELQVASDGAVTGTGFGCSFAGTLTGDIMAAGCEQPLFDGAYRMRLRGDSHGRLEVELEREAGGVEAEIEGVLIAETP